MNANSTSGRLGDYAIGIDLGTTNSVAAVCRNGAPEVIPVEQSLTVPSVVSFRGPDETLVGMSAKRRALIDPEHCVTSIKRQMGKRDFSLLYYGRSYTPADISSLILRKIKDEVEKHLGCAAPHAVITVPAYFTSRQKQDTKTAGEMAGFNVLRVMPEPTAAAIAYGLDRGHDQRLLVYDLGGGTFDVSIVEMKHNAFRVRAVGGNSQLGGDDFDWRIMQYLASEFNQQHGIDLLKNDGSGLSPQDRGSALQTLKEMAEKAKKDLSEAEVAEIIIPDVIGGRNLSAELSLTQFEDLISDLVWSTRDQIVQALSDAHMSPQDIDRVLMVGGSTRIPMIRRVVTELVKEPYIADNVDVTVAEGAAITAANLYEGKKSGVLIEFQNVTAHNLGTSYITQADDRPRCAVLIPRNTPLSEAHGSDMFTTHADYQDRVAVTIYQGLEEGETCGQNWLVDYFHLVGIQRAPRGVPQIKVRFEMDENDILHVSARDQATGASYKVEVTGVQTVRT